MQRRVSHETSLKLSAAHKGKKHTEESKAKISAFNSIAISIDGIEYKSMTEAGKALGVFPATISKRIASDKYPNYKRILK